MKMLNFKIHLLTGDDMKKHFTRKKFQGLFDVAVLGFIGSANLREPSFKKILSPNGKLYSETSKHYIPLAKKEQPKMREQLIKTAVDMGFREDKWSEDHHVKFTNVVEAETAESSDQGQLVGQEQQKSKGDVNNKKTTSQKNEDS